MTTPATLDDRIAGAQQAAAGPRKRVAELEATLTRAVTAGEYETAAQLKPELAAARDEMIVADAQLAALRVGADAARTAAQDEDRAIAEARQREQATQDLAAARADEQKHLAALASAVEAMFESLATAKQRFGAVGAADEAATAARHRQKTAQAALGAWPANHPGPAVNRSNRAQTLVDSDPLISQLVRWSPPTR